MACACACLMCACTSIKNIKGPVRYRPLSALLASLLDKVPVEEIAKYRRQLLHSRRFASLHLTAPDWHARLRCIRTKCVSLVRFLFLGRPWGKGAPGLSLTP